MKRIAKLILKPFWKLAGPVRRPLLARFDDRVARLVAGTVNARIMPELIEPLAIALRRLERIEDSLARADRNALAMAEEVDLVLNGVSREIFRVHAQLEQLRAALADDPRMTPGLSLIDGAGAESPVLCGPVGERSRVG